MEKIQKDTKYVLFLDDDVRLHPGSVGTLTAEMEKNPDVWSCCTHHNLLHKLSVIQFMFTVSFFI